MSSSPPTPQSLWLACQPSAGSVHDRIARVARLLDAGAPVRNAVEPDGSTALHQAARYGPLEMVELLLRHGAKEWQTDAHGKLPIDYARDGVAPDKGQIVELLDRPVIRDPHFKSAVRAIQSGDLAALCRLLAEHPNLVHDRATEPPCYPPSYFSSPKLLWFIANNPNLITTMPANSVEIAKAIIDAGAEKADLNYTLELVMTSLPAREQNLQRPLIGLLLNAGAMATTDGIYGTLGHRERDAMQAVLDAGLAMTAPIAAGMGRVDELRRLLPVATDDEKHAALSLAVINQELTCAQLCLDAGADVNQFLRVHKHSLPAHQAAINDDVPMLKLLIERGARLDVRDTAWNSTPLGWAVHCGKKAAEACLRSLGAT